MSILAILLVWRWAPTLALELTTTALAAAIVLPRVRLSLVGAGGISKTILILGLTGSTGRVGDWARYSLGGLIDIELLLDDGWNWLDLGTKFLFNLIEVEAIFPVDQVDRQTQVTKATRTTDAMQIGLSVLWKIEIDYNIDGLDIDTTGEEIGTNEIPADTVPEVVENTVTIVLKHARVRVEARISKLCDLFRKEFDAISRVAENNRLVDLQLVEESV